MQRKEKGIMPVDKVEAIVVGAGQAGLAMSANLLQADVPHLVLERSRIAERWRSWRWDGLVANGPAWHDTYPGLEFPDHGPEDFVPKEHVADAFAAFAAKTKLPVKCGIDVTSVRKLEGRRGFHVETSLGPLGYRRHGSLPGSRCT
jgi:putative flavoprotein involved in K+ transport